jgi:hypothetical protein
MRSRRSTRSARLIVRLMVLDGIPGLVPGLVPGFQGWKCPGTLAQPCCELKSLKFILSDSNFLCPPALNTLVTLGIYPSVNQEFFFR